MLFVQRGGDQPRRMMNETRAWSAFMHELQGEYSRHLYGVHGNVDVTDLQLIWVELLSGEALHAVKELGVCWWQSEAPHLLYARHSRMANPHGSLWVHTPHHVPVPSHGWIEVTHCGKPRGVGGGGSLPWFYAARGSGVSLNVGRTVAINLRAEPGCAHFLGRPTFDTKAEVLTCLHRCLRTRKYEDSEKLDSVQLLQAMDQYTDEPRHEIIMLSAAVLSESEQILVAASNERLLMCGKEPLLHRCTGQHAPIHFMSNCSTIIVPSLKPAMSPCGVRTQKALPPPLPASVCLVGE